MLAASQINLQTRIAENAHLRTEISRLKTSLAETREERAHAQAELASKIENQRQRLSEKMTELTELKKELETTKTTAAKYGSRIEVKGRIREFWK